MEKQSLKVNVCSFSNELRQRQVLRGLGLTVIATLILAAHLQQTGKLAPVNLLPHQTIVTTNNQVKISSYTPSTVAAVSQMPAPNTQANNNQKLTLPTNWSIESAAIRGSFQHSAHLAGLTNAEITGIKEIFADKIDFKHLHTGDHFKVINERIPASKTQPHPSDKIIAAEYISQGKTYTAIRFTNSNNQVNYFDQNGRGLNPGFLRYPTHYTRIGSGFMLHRLDPITGQYHTHPAIDFDAPMGTPIVATGDGKISFMSNEQGYGNVVKINHPGQILTLYAHMRNFAKGLHVGSTVTKGEVIGYVGMSGYATGPHVHYELHFGSRPVNPLITALPSTSGVPSSQHNKFNQLAKQLVGYLGS